MRHNKLVVAYLAIAAVFAVASTGWAVAPQSDGTLEQSFDVNDGGMLRIDASFGSIEVSTSDNNRVDVRVVREVRDNYDDDAARILAEHEVQIERTGDGVSVTTEVSDSARDRWRDDYRSTPLRVRFEITVPRNYDIDVETAGGNISVGDLNGEMRAETAGGNLEFGNISGEVNARTSGGNISLDGSSGTAHVRTSGGNITIGDVDGSVDAETSGGSIHIDRAGGEVRAETAGGNITVNEVGGTIDATTSGGNVSATITEQPQGDCRLSTSAGTVTVTLASGISVDIDARTSMGGVSSALSVDGSVSRNSISGRINGGGPELHLRSSAGRIRIRER